MENSIMSVKERVELLKAMNTIVLNENDENVCDGWITVNIPDNSSEEDYEAIASNDDVFLFVCKEFMAIMRNKDNELFLGKINRKFEVV